MAAAQVSRAVTIRVPGDKSITHRALLLASLADGESRIRNALDAADTRSTASAVAALARTAPAVLTNDIRIQGSGLHGWREPANAIDCGNSGTTARLLMGVLAGQPFDVALLGDASLQSRPMRRVTEPLTRMGAVFSELGAPDRLPIGVRGASLEPIDHESPQSSAQVKSALLLAALAGDARVTVREPRLSRDHTERMLAAMGVAVQRAVDADGRHTVTVDGEHALAPISMFVPGDFSSAAFFIASGLLADGSRIRLPHVGLNPGRIGMLDVVRRMNGVVDVRDVRHEANEPMGDVLVASSELRAVTIEAHEVPSLIDEIPIIAALAVRAEGETRIAGASELRVKETDRIRALVGNLQAIGVEAEELADGLTVHGTRSKLRGSIRTFGDHRIAMAFGVLAALPGSEIEIDDRDVVGVSFPGFWRALDSVFAEAK